MAATSVEDRFHQLYGPGRFEEAQKIRLRNSTSHVTFGLLDGNKSSWKTSSGDLVSGWKGDQQSRGNFTVAGSVEQLRHHFELSRSEEVPQTMYQSSVAKETFVHVPTEKIKPILKNVNTVNWPDMAPDLSCSKSTGHSEAHTAYLNKTLEPHQPEHKRPNASHAGAGDAARSRYKKSVTFEGNEKENNLSTETSRSYSAPSYQGEGFQTTELSVLADNARRASRGSSIFRNADIKGAKSSQESATSIDFPTALKRASSHGPEATSDTSDSSVTLGRDPRILHSLYVTDYRGTTGRRQTTLAPPTVSHVLQQDPGVGWTRTLSTNLHTDAITHRLEQNQGQPGGEAHKNALKHGGDHVFLSCDPTRHTEDRQKSLSHSYYSPQLSVHHTQSGPRASIYNYITGDTEQGTTSQTEAQSQYRSYPSDPTDRYSRKHLSTRRQQDLQVNINFGFQPKEVLTTQSRATYRGGYPDLHSAAAGVTNPQAPVQFNHMTISANVPETHTGSGVGTKHALTGPPADTHYRASVMGSDYLPPKLQKVSAAHQVVLNHTERLQQHINKTAPSHYFHKDHQIRGHYETTQRSDYIRPELMPPKLHPRS